MIGALYLQQLPSSRVFSLRSRNIYISSHSILDAPDKSYKTLLRVINSNKDSLQGFGSDIKKVCLLKEVSYKITES